MPHLLNSWLLKKLELSIYPQKFCYAGYEISANYPLFLNNKLDKNETISIFVARSWISKIKHAQRLLIVDVCQIKNQTNSHYLMRTNHVNNIMYIQYIYLKIRTLHVASTMIKYSCKCYCSRNRGRWLSHNWSKIKKKKYINLRDHDYAL